MKVLRAIVAVALLAVAAIVGYGLYAHRPGGSAGGSIAVYYVGEDGETLSKWNVSLSPGARDTQSVAYYATAQSVAGPPPGTPAIRFPSGTVARSVHLAGTTATVDLGGAIASSQSGSLTESGEFKALVWTLTALPHVDAVQVTVDGARVPTLPGGHLELDEPLSRRSW